MAAAWKRVDLVVEAQLCRLMTIVVGGLGAPRGWADDKLGALASSLPRSGCTSARATGYLVLGHKTSAPDPSLPTVLFLYPIASQTCSKNMHFTVFYFVHFTINIAKTSQYETLNLERLYQR